MAGMKPKRAPDLLSMGRERSGEGLDFVCFRRKILSVDSGVHAAYHPCHRKIRCGGRDGSGLGLVCSSSYAD